MKNFVILIAILAVVSAKSVDVDPSQVQPFESIGIDWSQVQPIEDSEQYWSRLPADLQYLRKHQPDGRIVNGQEATPGQFPYYAYLSFQREGMGRMCGGSILKGAQQQRLLLSSYSKFVKLTDPILQESDCKNSQTLFLITLMTVI